MPLPKKIASVQILGLFLLIGGTVLAIRYKDPTVRLATYMWLGICPMLIFFNESSKKNALKFHWLGFSLTLTGSVVFGGWLIIYDPIGRSLKANQIKAITILVHGKAGNDILVMKGHGFVVMQINGSKNREPIDYQGLAKFSNLRMGDSFRLSIDDSEPYKVRKRDSTYTVGNQYEISLEVYLEGIQSIFGFVRYNDAPLPSVRVSYMTVDTTTDYLGRFVLNIPDSLQRQGYYLNFDKKGFKSITAKAYPESNQPLPINMDKQ